MIKKIFNPPLLGLFLLATVRLWSQVDSAGSPASVANANVDRMLTPPPVSGQLYPVAPASEERSNFLRGGVTFSSAYSDNVLGSTTGSPLSDVSYSVWPTVALDDTTSRLRLTLSYEPGFTFYQRISSRNQADQNASINLQYRLSPHVTISARDGFQKTSNVFNQPDLASSGAVSGGTQEANLSVIPPTADRLSNFGNVGISYQFAANEMIGASGTFTNVHYPRESNVPGLFDSSSQGGSAFYARRVSSKHYLGASYQYQNLLSYPTPGKNEVQTHAVVLFYTLYVSPRLSMSMFGGPQYSDISPQFSAVGPNPQAASRDWTPAAGASVDWQGKSTSVAASFSHVIAGGSGLLTGVHMDSASAFVRQKFSRALSASLSGGYTQNTVVGGLSQTGGASTNGHTVSGTVALQRQFGEHLNAQLGYTRFHQSYNVAAISAAPDTNREFISLSWEFSRPLGR